LRFLSAPSWTGSARRSSCGRGAWALGALLILFGCATPVERAYQEARESGFQFIALDGGAYRLAAFFKPAQRADAETLHVYLDGDGTPWASRWRVSEEPTPRHPVMLRLMALDSAPALYLGRPCYFGHASDPGCSPELWTGRRYGPEVLDSLEVGLRGFLKRRPFQRLALLGHSGGGALALLLAPRFPEAWAVLTLAGNTDTAAWTARHGYTPLSGSLNPADAPPGRAAEFHYLGAEDRVIPPEVFGPIAQRRSPGGWAILPKMGHSCCWEGSWGTILKRLDSGSGASRPVP